MNPIMDNVMAFATVLAPIATALVQVIKNSFPIPKNILPLVGLVIAIALSAIAYPFTDLELVTRLWAGGLAGLSSVGVFELFNTRAGLSNEPKIASADKVPVEPEGKAL